MQMKIFSVLMFTPNNLSFVPSDVLYYFEVTIASQCISGALWLCKAAADSVPGGSYEARS